MLRFAIVVGLLLIAVSVVAAVRAETQSLTTWIPAVLGAVIAMRATWALSHPAGLRFAVGMIRLMALLGAGASLWKLSQGGFDLTTNAHQAQAVTTLLCVAVLLRSLKP